MNASHTSISEKFQSESARDLTAKLSYQKTQFITEIFSLFDKVARKFA